MEDGACGPVRQVRRVDSGVAFDGCKCAVAGCDSGCEGCCGGSRTRPFGRRHVRGSLGGASARGRTEGDVASAYGGGDVVRTITQAWGIWRVGAAGVGSTDCADRVLGPILPGLSLDACGFMVSTEADDGTGITKLCHCVQGKPPRKIVTAACADFGNTAAVAVFIDNITRTLEAVVAESGTVSTVHLGGYAVVDVARAVERMLFSSDVDLRLSVDTDFGSACDGHTKRCGLCQGLVPLFLNLHVVARSSAQADIEVNPGPTGSGSTDSLGSSDVSVFPVLAPVDVRHWRDNQAHFGVLAWLGGTKHTLDVQTAVAAVGIPMSKATMFMQRYVSAEARSAYYRTLRHPSIIPASDADRSYADAFKAAYDGQFRADYVEWLSAELAREHDGAINETCMAMQEEHVRDFGKVFCAKCKFMVVADDHASRCRVPEGAVERDLVRRKAWLGDRLSTLDVSRLLLRINVPAAKLQEVCARFVSAEAHEDFLRNEGFTFPSRRAASTYLEANYLSTFRHAYLTYVSRQLESQMGLPSQDSFIDQLDEEFLVGTTVM